MGNEVITMTNELTVGDIQLPAHINELAHKCHYRHVRVVQAILSCNYSSNTRAYQSVYPNVGGEVAATNVWRMLKNADVSALYTALRDVQLLEGIITRNEAIKILSDMARASMGDLIEWRNCKVATDEDDTPILQTTWSFKDLENLTLAQLRSIAEVAATPQGIKIKQHDPKAAIKQLADMLGWNGPQEISLTNRIRVIPENISLEEATQIYEQKLRSRHD